MAGFFDVAAADPERLALIEPGIRSSSYGEMAAAAHRLARGLQDRRLERGDTVAIISGNRREMLEVYAAAVELGLYIVVVNWHLNASEIAYILVNSGARTLFAEDRHVTAALAAAREAAIPAHLRFVIGGDTFAGDEALPFGALTEGQPDLQPEHRYAGQVTFYTSGTTGRPKGVRKAYGDTPASEIRLGVGFGLRQLDPDADVVQLVAGPLYHGAPLAAAIMALDAGGRVVLMEHFVAQRFLELIEEHRVTTMSVVPTMFHRLLALPDEVRRGADLSSLRSVSHMGAPCPVDVKHRMIEWIGPIITESYSATEGAGTSISSEEWLARPGSVGRPSPGVTIAILDAEGAPCVPGDPGLVYLSPTLWQFEYLGDPERTAATRRDGLFTVGDIGYLDDEGYLFLCDREAEIIVSGGVNIYPVETEAALLEHSAVGDVAVVGVPSAEWGEEVRAVVEPVAGVIPDDDLAAELIAHCRVRIADYKCPRAIDFELLGRDPNGKIRKASIRDEYWRGESRRI